MRLTAITSGQPFIKVSGYAIVEQLYKGSRTIVYRAIEDASQRPVIIKLLQQDYPSFNDLLQFRNQYTIAKNLNISGIVRPYSLESCGNSYALVMEDFGGISLQQYAEMHVLSVLEIVTIALQLTKILHELHQARVIHKDIKPANILIHPVSKQVKLIDFSIASLLPKETQDMKNPNGLEGTLAYLAPEQTGRMNRGIDYRADFYALGVTLFELFMKQLPFPSDDPMELVHCHLAKPPPTMESLNSQVPLVLSKIVSKLMAKNAEDRYQSGLGLQHDLQICLDYSYERGEIEEFEIATRDVCDRFLVPEKLYGRETEVKMLLDAFDRVAEGASELMLVAGFSGIGKTAVVNEIHKPIVRQRGYFIKGKFDQFNRNIPLSAFVQALRDLMGQLLSESDTQLAQWNANILAAVGENGQVLVDVIPELEHIIGKQPIAVEVSGSAAQNRFNLLFQKFIEVFTNVEHPLVLFLDDLQWADSASLQLIKLLMNDNGHLLIVGAYRDNEVSSVHPCSLTVEEIKKTKAIVNTITLLPLTFSDTNHLVADTLNCSIALAQPLTGLVDRKTKGNPFFTTQFLKALYEDGQIHFVGGSRSPGENHDRGYWECDIAQVNTLALTDDVVEFMALQLQKLPDETQSMLKLAACVGNQFDLVTLAIVSEQSPADAATALWKALQEGLILPMSQVYKFFQDGEQTDTQSTINPAYRFLHDRVQQAAYTLIPDDQNQVMHLQIGQLLSCKVTANEREERLFEIVNHFNIGQALILLPHERENLAQLNLMAGRKAKASIAYGAAINYFMTSLSFLPEEAWESHYKTALEIHTELVDATYLNAEYEQMEQWITLVLQQAKTQLDTIPIQRTQLIAERSQGQFLNSLQIGLKILQSLGVEFPEQPTQADIGHAVGVTRRMWEGRSLASLLDLPTMTDPHRLAAMEIMTVMVASAAMSNPALMPLLILKQVELSIQYGNCPISIFAYADYGLVLCGVIGDIISGYDFGQLALKLLDNLQIKPLKSRALYVFCTYIQHWKDPLQKSISCLREGYQSGLETGDIESASLSAAAYCYYSYHVGKELIGLADEIEWYRQNIWSLKQKSPQYYLEIYQQTVFNLLGRTEIPYYLTGTIFNEIESLPLLQATNNRAALFYFYFNQMVLNYLFGQYQQAAQSSSFAEQYLDGGIGTFMVALYSFYDSLVQLALYHSSSEENQCQILERLVPQQDKLKGWVMLSPCNHQHRSELVEAEYCGVLVDRPAAIDLYDRAIFSAHENGFIQDEALANELAAKFYLKWGKEKVAAGYMQDAYYCYARWGAKAKTDDLKNRYPNLLYPILQQAVQGLNIAGKLETIVAPNLSIDSSNAPSRSSSTNMDTALDVAAILKACQSLSGTVKLDELMCQLTQIILQNSGGDRCVLILPNSVGEWFIEATATLDTTELCSERLDFNCNVPSKLIQYVKHTQEAVLINNLKTDLPVIDDYLIQQQPKSLLCIPIFKQGKLAAILYLENHVTIGAFTNDRIEVLNFLCTQAAISLENAHSYAQEQEKSQQLQEKNHLLAFQSTISHNVARNDDLSVMLQQFCQVTVDYLDAAFVRIWLLNIAENVLELKASAGLYTHLNGAHQYVPVGKFKIGLIAQEKTPHLTNDVLNDPRVGDHEWARQQGMVAFAGHPLMIGSELLGVVAMFARNPLSVATLASLQIVATEISLGVQRKALEISVEQKTIALEQTLQNLQNAQLQMVQNEKMASLGNLVAGIAHEINNPIGFLNGSIKNARDYVDDLLGYLAIYQQHHPNSAVLVQDYAEDIDLEFLREDLPKLLNSMKGATDRIKGISTSLRAFSRADTEYKVSANLHEGIDSTLLILKYRLKANEIRPAIQVIQDYGELPDVECFPGQLNQVSMNILANAIDVFDEMAQTQSFKAIEANPQQITIRTAIVENQVRISIRDNGKGMAEDIQEKIFDHLFTTKGVGQGTGLGLAIARQIVVEKHGGTIDVNSVLGQGTEFVLSLPVA